MYMYMYIHVLYTICAVVFPELITNFQYYPSCCQHYQMLCMCPWMMHAMMHYMCMWNFISDGNFNSPSLKAKVIFTWMILVQPLQWHTVSPWELTTTTRRALLSESPQLTGMSSYSKQRKGTIYTSPNFNTCVWQNRGMSIRNIFELFCSICIVAMWLWSSIRSVVHCT